MRSTFLTGATYMNINTRFTWQEKEGVNGQREYSGQVCFATLFLFLM